MPGGIFLAVLRSFFKESKCEVLELEDKNLMFKYKSEAQDVLFLSLAGIPSGISNTLPASPALPGFGALPRMRWLLLLSPKAAIPAGPADPETLERKFLESQDG